MLNEQAFQEWFKPLFVKHHQQNNEDELLEGDIMMMTKTAIFKEVIKVIVVGAALAGNIATARAIDIQAPQPAVMPAVMKVMDVTLAIKSPDTNICPAVGKLKAWVKTNKAGPVDYFFAKEGGAPGALKTVDVKKSSNGYMLIISQALGIHQATDTKYRLFAKGADGKYVKSMWVPLKASCKISLGAKGLIKQ